MFSMVTFFELYVDYTLLKLLPHSLSDSHYKVSSFSIMKSSLYIKIEKQFTFFLRNGCQNLIAKIALNLYQT